ncbi:heme-binding protein 2-like [Daphnia pulicaria]|uniref:heme-binding protein 2-like n=1 Tax=Daphnia pulicaria TaxID=35523 RepID=UPI001EEBE53C|nr:heme-binding protein 2-like [Daphnia pulicaria]XP_046637178.1 heme-binding protein 2-like [Daphnia pulicaria]
MSCRLGAIALVLALCAVSVHSQVWGYVSQSFSLVRSDILEAADYELVANISNRDAGENYEERLYPASKWACTARTVPKTESSPTRSMFVDLFRYFAGDNSDKKEIDLTVPVNTFVQQRDNDVTYYETCLTLPKKVQSAAPKPNNPSVFLDEKPEMVILTRRVSGYFITDTAWEEEAISLKKVLKEKVPEADYQSYYRNGYDAPMRIFNRRNEVWFRKTGEAAQKTIEDYKKRQAEKAVVAAAAAEEEKKPAADEKKPVADEKKPVADEKKTTEKKTEDKKTEEKKKVEEPKKDAAQNRE